MEATTDSAPLRAVEATYEVRMLDAMLEDSPKCEANHTTFDCSVEVVAIASVKCNHARGFICSNAAEHVKWGSESGLACDSCKNLVRDCWKIIPI